MQSEKKILIAFLLNLCFSIFEFIGGVFTGSIAIVSDAVHDIGDAISIGFSFFLERKSKMQPDETYTYGYGRYSVVGGFVTTLILLLGSVMVIFNAILRITTPTPINYNGMILFAVIGAVVNIAAAFFTRDGHSFNQKAVNLHMLEDVLGWIIVLIGAIIMRFTNFAFIDPIMSIGVALFILINVVKNLKEVLDIFLEKAPHCINILEIKKDILKINSVTDVHHIHVWSMDGIHNYATMHIVTNADSHKIKDKIREKLKEHDIGHATLELESETELCREMHCAVDAEPYGQHHHHHHCH